MKLQYFAISSFEITKHTKKDNKISNNIVIPIFLPLNLSIPYHTIKYDKFLPKHPLQPVTYAVEWCNDLN